MPKSSFLLFFIISIILYITYFAAVTKKTRIKRPFLKSNQAKYYSIAHVLKYKGNAKALICDPWNPVPDITKIFLKKFEPNYIVDKYHINEDQKIFKTIQSAINKACLDMEKNAGKDRIYIEIKPGIYNELLIIPDTPIPITLYSSDQNASSTKIIEDIDQGLKSSEYSKKFNPCSNVFTDKPDITYPKIRSMYDLLVSKNSTLGASGSAVVWIKNNGFQAKNLTFENSYDQRRPGNLQQAVAVKVDSADRVHFDNCSFISNQDTLFICSGKADSTIRVFLRNCYIQGDVDFIFGNGTAYFKDCEIKWSGVRKNGSQAKSGFIAAPSTNYNIPYGFVFNNCDFTHDGTGLASSSQVHLARQWFEGVKASPYNDPKVAVDLTNTTDNENIIKLITLETVGKMIVINSRIGSHINKQNPWYDWNNKPDNKAYRLVQFNSDDYWENLKKAGINPSVIYKCRKKPAEPFLAEYNNKFFN
ncbi:MAG: hypothetical protein JXB50_09225 [Spirochaetes bacterium]|nr:hypothetical protein [Spirochaetota bacterium]